MSQSLAESTILFYEFSSMAIIFIIFIAIISGLITKWIYKYYKKMDFKDIPKDRNLHDSPVITGGGLSIIIINMVAIYLFQFSLLFSLGVIIVSVLGFFDDKINLSPLIRIFVHFLCAFLIIKWIGNFPIIDFGIFFGF